MVGQHIEILVKNEIYILCGKVWGGALAEPGVTYNKNCAPEGAQESFKSINQKQIVDQMEHDAHSKSQ